MTLDSDLEVARARLGRRVAGRWLLERVIGTGGMAAVYAGRAPDGAIAAIKILHPEMSARREVRERFLREGSAASKIGHPGVVQMLGQGDGDEAFLAMELLEGETLRDRVRRHGRLPLDEVLDYAEQVLDVLVAAHERGVVHRDLKPDNLFVTHGDRIKVLDFGLARVLDGVPGQHQTRTGVALGTLAYMAPEQALGRRGEIDGRVDVFALGATMFRVLSGRRVHEAESEAELLMAMASRPAPPLRSVAPETPEGIAGIVDLSLAFSRDARYPDARTMRADVQAARRGAAPPYATGRLATRDERTRADLPAFSASTQPLDTVRDPTSGRTVPLAVYAEPTAPYPGSPLSSSPTVVEAPPLSARAPVSRTEPLLQVPARTLPALAAVPSVTAAPSPFLPGPLAVALPGAPPVAGTARPTRAGRLLPLFVVLGTLAVASAGGFIAYLVLAKSPPASQDAASAPLQAALPAAAPAAGNGAATEQTARGVAVPVAELAAKPRARGTSPEPARPNPTTSASVRGASSAVVEPTPAPTPAPTPTPTQAAATTGSATATSTASAAAPSPVPSGQVDATRDAGSPNRIHRGRGRARD